MDMTRLSYVHKFHLGNWKTGIFFKLWYAKIENMIGWSSQIPDSGNQVIFWDFKENIDYPILRYWLRKLQFDNHLGNIYIFRSGIRSSYRAICLDSICTESALRYIASMFRYVDLAFLQKCLGRKYAILRLSPKDDEQIIFYDILYRFCNNPSSNAHAQVLKHLYNCPPPEHLDESDPRKLKLEQYETIVRR